MKSRQAEARLSAQAGVASDDSDHELAAIQRERIEIARLKSPRMRGHFESQHQRNLSPPRKRKKTDPEPAVVLPATLTAGDGAATEDTAAE